MPTFSLAGNCALVTGSSQGIGYAIAQALHTAGARVVFHGKEPAAPALPAGATYLAADLLQPDAPAQLVRSAFTAYPDLDRLGCNAGSFFDVPFLEMTSEAFQSTL